MMWNLWVTVVVVLCTLGTGVSGTRCRKYSTYSRTTYYTYCPDLCCGSDGSQNCCDTSTAGLWLGLGIAVAGVSAGVIIPLIVVIICICKQKYGGERRRVGTVITPPSQNTTVFTTTGPFQCPCPTCSVRVLCRKICPGDIHGSPGQSQAAASHEEPPSSYGETPPSYDEYIAATSPTYSGESPPSYNGEPSQSYSEESSSVYDESYASSSTHSGESPPSYNSALSPSYSGESPPSYDEYNAASPTYSGAGQGPPPYPGTFPDHPAQSLMPPSDTAYTS